MERGLRIFRAEGRITAFVLLETAEDYLIGKDKKYGDRDPRKNRAQFQI